MEISDADIQTLRSAFFQKIADKGLSENEEFHPADINRIKANGDWLKRFLLHQDNDQTEALKMLWECCEWRKSFGTNDITEKNIDMAIVQEGSVFPHNRDKDGKALLIFKSKKHVKGKHDFDELKRVLIYWIERLEREKVSNRVTVFFDFEGSGIANMDMEMTRYIIDAFRQKYPAFLHNILIFEQPWIFNVMDVCEASSSASDTIFVLKTHFGEENGDVISIFFDMDGAGLSNMDMEYTKYIISLFKVYYPLFLNNIYILEMAWVLNAAFKVIKTWLPPKAVQKMKFVSKSGLKEFVTPEQSLKNWGGLDDYVFEFVPEIKVPSVEAERKKVHFADRSPVSDDVKSIPESPSSGNYNNASHRLTINPTDLIQFKLESGEVIASLLLKNDESLSLSYKIKTTSPEKFRVRPSAGMLSPGASATVNVVLQPGYDNSGLQRDKFLVMSVPVSTELASLDLTELWKVAGKDVVQHRLRCSLPTPASTSEVSRNGGLPEGDRQLTKLSTEISKLHNELHSVGDEVRRIQIQQWVLLLLVGLLTALTLYLSKQEPVASQSTESCYAPPLP